MSEAREEEEEGVCVGCVPGAGVSVAVVEWDSMREKFFFRS